MFSSGSAARVSASLSNGDRSNARTRTPDLRVQSFHPADFHGWTKAFDRRQLRECATGDYMDPFADWLKSAGFRRRSAQLLLRGAAHLGEWAAIEQVRIEQFDQRVLDTFAGHLATCCCTHPFRGGDRRNLRGAKRCIEHLQIRGITAFAEHEARPLPVMVDAFNGWMRRHRGATESTIALYASIVLKKGCGLRW